MNAQLTRPPDVLVIPGDCLDVLRSLDANSIDAVITDPPYGLGKEPTPAELVAIVRAWILGEAHEIKGRGFMGKSWDAFVPHADVWRECLRVLKPGGHLVTFAGTRTQDLVGLAVRLAGFEIRDCLQWIYGQGFPKSLDFAADPVASKHARKRVIDPRFVGHAQAEGYGTALKPAYEPILLCRKPLDGTVAGTVLAHGTGGINVDGCRIESEGHQASAGTVGGYHGAESGHYEKGDGWQATALGRFPANVILNEAAGAMLDAQAGDRPGMKSGGKHRADAEAGMFGAIDGSEAHARGDSGGPSRFLYCAKASRSEREHGLESLPIRSGGDLTDREDGSAGLESPRAGAGRKGGRRNTHPTVKPLALMAWLARLVTPPGGTIVDPFAGSGTMGLAGVEEGFDVILIEREDEYMPILRARFGAP